MKNSSKRILFFEYSISGHRLEYIHHLYIKAIEYQGSKFIFALPKEFLDVKGKLLWPESSNIEFYIFDSVVVTAGSVFKDSFKKGVLLKSIIKKNNIDSVFIISLMEFLPALPFLLSKKIKISGVIYMIYLYRWKESSWFVKMQDALKYFLFSKMSIFHKVFILNDSASARYLNKKFKTEKFQFLPDPYVPILEGELNDLRNELNILPTKRVFLHFGALTQVKGTIDILEAIELIGANELKDMCFIFAGKVSQNIREVFYKKLSTQNKRAQILCFDEFCDYSFLGSLCISCDYILIPYKRTSQSSGLIGFAAQFNKPVIAPQEKLLGKLVKKHNLGITVKDVNPSSLAATIKKIDKNSNWVNTSSYMTINSVENFTDVIFSEVV